MLDLATLLLAGTAVLVGSAVQGMVGFGLGLLAAPIIALVDPTLVPGALLVVTVALPALSVVRERGDADWPGLRWALLGRVPGTAAGTWAVATVPGGVLSIVVGVVVIAAVLLSLSTWQVKPTPRTLFTAGVISGATGTATSIGGPPIALVYQHESGPRLRSTLGVYFVVGTTFSIAVLVAAGQLHGRHLLAGAALLPFLVVGFLISGPLRTRLDRGWLRPAVLVVAGVSAMVLVVRSLL